MAGSTIVVATFVAFLLFFVLVGALAARAKKATPDDFLVASRGVNPWLTALSSVSTNHSGFMFIGLIGFTWRYGVQAVWLMLGWFIGDLLTWPLFHRRVRELSAARGIVSYPALLGARADGGTDRVVVVAAGVLTFFFLGGYAAAQLKAGATTLQGLFGWELWVGAVIGLVIVEIYAFAGGIRASIWTDAAQSLVMVVSMTALVGFCWAEAGSPVAVLEALRAVDPALVTWAPPTLAFGFGLYLLGFVFGGAGVAGQPHVMIRFMALDDPRNLRVAGLVYFVWYAFFSTCAVLAGLYGRVLLPDLVSGVETSGVASAAELAMPRLALAVLPDVFVGVLLAGIFSATMSTADSQILSCSAAVTQDVAPRFEKSYAASRLATVGVAILALVVALLASDGVFGLVLFAWSVLAAAFLPVLWLRLRGATLPTWLALTMMASGIVTVFRWPFSGDVFELLPGIVVPFVVYLAGRAFLSTGEARGVGVTDP